MKIFKRILAAILVLLVLLMIGGYFYFDKKFTPEDNYLTVENESGSIPITWLGLDKNVLLVAVHFPNNKATYYLQFDTGSPYTIFYAYAIKDIDAITVNGNVAKTAFTLGLSNISSDNFKVLNQEESNTEKDSIKIIGTLGADILENRRTVLDFKSNTVSFNLKQQPAEFKGKQFDFDFKKRKIILKGVLKDAEEKFLFDSGTSAFELLVNKEVWQDLKLDSSKIKTEKSQSWENVLTTYTANCKQEIKFNGLDIPLNNVTYVEGFSKTQYLLMKFSGMTGMLGNKIFLNNSIYIDCTSNKIAIQ